jgi:hypothetical protein
VCLLILPAVISLSSHTAVRYIIAAAALLVILVGVLFSKRKMTSFDTPVGESAPAAVVAE